MSLIEPRLLATRFYEQVRSVKRDFGWCWFIPKVVGNISYWLVVWNLSFFFHSVGNNDHPKWWTHIFQGSCFTTNHHSISENCWACQFIEDFKSRQYTENWTNWPTSAVNELSQSWPYSLQLTGEAPKHGQVDKSKAFTELPSALDSIRSSAQISSHTRKAPRHSKPLIPSHWRGIVHVGSSLYSFCGDFWGNGLLIRGGTPPIVISSDT